MGAFVELKSFARLKNATAVEINLAAIPMALCLATFGGAAAGAAASVLLHAFEAPGDIRVNTFDSGGFAIAYDDIPAEGGEVGTAVLVHGFATAADENWRRLGWYASFSRKGYRVLALDLRGHGRSAKPHDPAAYRFEALADDVVAMMDHAGVGRVE